MPEEPKLCRRRIAQDGACLFNSIRYLCSAMTETPDSLREHCATIILSSPEIYNATYLDKEPAAYAEWIRDPVQYGGEIEILILAEKFKTKISVVDCQVGSRAQLLTYGPDEATTRIYMAYSGRHYDALVTTQRRDGEVDDETCTRRFSEDQCTGEGGVDTLAKLFADTERDREQIDLLTRIRKKIKCGGCGALLADNEAFQTHCTEVEHDDDFAYDCEEVEVRETVANVDDD